MECTVNSKGDLYANLEARNFIEKDCIILKTTKSGLIQVALKDNPKKVYSLPKRNITFYQ